MKSHDDYLLEHRLKQERAAKKTSTSSKPEPAPKVKQEPAPKEKTQEEKMQLRLADEQLALDVFQRPENLEWFDDSVNEPVAIQNAVAVVEWVREHREGYISSANVVDGIRALRGKLTPVRKPEPARPAPAPVISKVISTPSNPAPPVDPLPELPPCVLKILGSNPLRTRRDVRDIPPSLYSELYRGVHGEQFRARVNAILAKGI
jgi:hypothetical protein